MISSPSIVSPKFHGSRISIRRGSDPSPPISPRSPTLRPIHITAAVGSAAYRPAVAAAPPTSLYDVLGIAAGSTGNEIKSAYRRLARTCHPDVVSVGGDAAADEFMRIHAAYSTLSDPEKRADYDRKLLFLGRQRRPENSSPSFAGYARRRWETDQCW